MSEPPQRYKAREAWTVGETVEHQQTGKQPETAEYREYVRKVHEDAGLVPPESASEPKDLEDLTADEHLARIQGRE